MKTQAEIEDKIKYLKLTEDTYSDCVNDDMKKFYHEAKSMKEALEWVLSK